MGTRPRPLPAVSIATTALLPSSAWSTPGTRERPVCHLHSVVQLHCDSLPAIAGTRELRTGEP
jgi:hypothetical protein